MLVPGRPRAGAAILIGVSGRQQLDLPPAVVFDLDGTLVDTVPARIRAWREVLAADGIEAADERLAPMIGMDGRRLAREAAAAAGRELTDEEADRLDREAGERFEVHNRAPQPLPGARVVLGRLYAAGVTWAIATSSRAEQVTTSVQALEAPTAARIVDGSRVRNAKPAPDLLLLAAKEIGYHPEDVWYVGDSTWDMAAAVAAGMRPVAVLAGSAVDAGALRAAGAAAVLDTLDHLAVRG